MAIRDDNAPPSKPGSITQAADQQIDRIGNVSNVSRTVSTMQKDVKQQITETQKMVDEGEAISSVQSSMTKVLDKLADTVGALGSGVKTITTDTAKATKDAIGDYGKAISEDISFNKQSVVAMALAKSTPIYGYFVAKFMETDVFKRAAERMKQSIGKAFGSLAGVFRRDAKSSGKDVNVKGHIPHMQKGGYVEKEGVAKIHAGEVVMPIEKILDRMDDNTNVAKNVSKILSKITLQQAASTKAMQTIVVGKDDSMFGKRKVGIAKDFLRLLREEKERYKDPIEQQQLRALLAIKEVLGAEIKIWPEVWSKLLMKHPGFRNVMAMGKLVSKLVGLTLWQPAYQLFKRRGGYARYLSRSDRPLDAINQNIGLQFVESMYRYDNMLNLLKAIAQATRDTAASITGRKYGRLKGVGTGEWSIGGSVVRLGAWLTGMGMRGLGKIPKMGALGTAGKFLTGRAWSTRESREYELGGSNVAGVLGSPKRPMIVEDVNWAPVAKIMQTRIRQEQKLLPIPKKYKEKKILIESAQAQVKTSKKLSRFLKGNRLIKWLMIGFSFVTAWIKKFWDKSVGKLFKMGAKKFASWLGLDALGRFGAGKGGKGAMLKSAFGRIPPGMAKVVGAGGIAAGVAMGVYDAIQAVQLADKWKTSKTSAGIGGFLGGTDKGLSGAMKGAGKYGAIGAGIGTMIVPGLGTAIGGAIGVVAGGILGFVGGEKIAKGFDAVGKYLKKFVSAAWGIVKMPFAYIGKGWEWLKEQITWDNVLNITKGAVKLGWKIITLPHRLVWKAFEFFAPNMAEKVVEIVDKAKALLAYPLNFITSAWEKIKEFISSDNIVTKTFSKFISVVSWPFRKISEVATSIYDWFFSSFDMEDKKKNVTSFISWPFRKIKETASNVKNWFLETFNIEEHKENIIGFVTWPVRKIKSIADSIYNWVSGQFNVDSIMTSLRKPMDALFGVFAWFGDLFGRIKNSIVEGISKIPGISWFMGDDKGPPDKPKAGGIKESIAASTEASKKATKSLWGKVKGWWSSDEPKNMAEQAQKGAEKAMKKTKAATSSMINKMTPKAKQAFQTAKAYYMKEFGWTEAQADAVLQTIAATAGDKLDLFSDPEKLKQMAGGMYTTSMTTVKDRFSAMVDKGEIAINEANLMLANGEMITENLGKKIIESSKELGDKTIQGAGAVANTVATTVTNISTNNQSTSVSQGGGGSRTQGRSYFDDLVYTGNYR